MMWSIAGAKLGGPTITQAPAASIVWPPFLNVTLALTGPSETSSCHPLLLAKVVRGLPVGDDERPKPPRTSSRALPSERISPSFTVLPRNFPVLNKAAWLRPLTVRAPGSIIRDLRSATPALRRGAFAFNPSNRFHSALVFARWTVHS